MLPRTTLFPTNMSVTSSWPRRSARQPCAELRELLPRTTPAPLRVRDQLFFLKTLSEKIGNVRNDLSSRHKPETIFHRDISQGSNPTAAAARQEGRGGRGGAPGISWGRIRPDIALTVVPGAGAGRICGAVRTDSGATGQASAPQI